MAGELGFDTGPYVNFAVFCETVMHEKTEVLSLIRIVDQITVSVSGEGVSKELPPEAGLNTTLAVGLKAGKALGQQTVQITVEHPDGSRHPGPDIPVFFTPGPSGGANLVLTMGISLTGTGVYWTDILVNGRIVTRIPLEVRYQVIPPGMQVR